MADLPGQSNSRPPSWRSIAICCVLIGNLYACDLQQQVTPPASRADTGSGVGTAETSEPDGTEPSPAEPDSASEPSPDTPASASVVPAPDATETPSTGLPLPTKPAEPGSETPAGEPLAPEPIALESMPETSEADAGEPPVEAGTPEPDAHPVFVAYGHGGWTGSTCDGGRVWNVHEYSESRDDHDEWSSFGGIAFGNGRFVAGSGWGADGHLISSADGVNWTEQALNTYSAAVVFTGTDFSVFGRERLRTADGVTLEAQDYDLLPGVHQIRQMRGFDDGLLLAAVETQREGSGHALGSWLALSRDDGESWNEALGATPSCTQTAHYYGDLVRMGDRLVVGAGSGDLCLSPDLGKTWSNAENRFDGAVAHLFSNETLFFALVDQELYSSPTGEVWTLVSSVEQAGSSVGQGAFGASMMGELVVTDGKLYFYSEDLGKTWERGEALGSGNAPTSRLHDIVVGKSTSACN